MIERLSPDLLFAVGIGAILLMLVWAYVRRRIRFKVPQKWVIIACIAFSILFHLGLLLILPQLGDPGQQSGPTTSPNAELSTLVTVVATEDSQTLESSPHEDSNESILRAPPLMTPSLPIPLNDLSHQEDGTSLNKMMNLGDPFAGQKPILPLTEIDSLLSDLLLSESPRQDPREVPAQEGGNRELPQAQIPQAQIPQPQGQPGDRHAAAVGVPSGPNDFSNRQGASRIAAVREYGGDERTEAAVEAALQFLTRTQEADGRWSAARHGAGREDFELGQARNGTGREADAGVTGLALLAMLGRGITPNDPQYGSSLMRGLSWLRSIQRSDGSLAGRSDHYSAMYCHGIASLAVMEAYALTGDAVLRQMAISAMSYTVRSQHPVTGGWRYAPGEPGDLSQLGWQAMALQTGRLTGLPVPEGTLAGMARFLHSVRMGRAGGLAAYRPGERATATMTAEALATKLLLGIPVSEAEAREAESMILAERPGLGRDNLYFWYYASLALHQRGGGTWDVWNQGMKTRLLATQLNDGSWPTDSAWGGYGGQIYTTSTAALCLEVYYRHLSIYRNGQK